MNYVTGKTIKALREKRKMTQKELADQISVSDKTVSKWETGKGLPAVALHYWNRSRNNVMKIMTFVLKTLTMSIMSP